MALGLLSLISTRAPALDAAAGASSIGEWEAAWTKVLTRHVDDRAASILARAPSLIAYINRYREAPIPADFNVRFLEYHWTVNHRKWAYVR